MGTKSGHSSAMRLTRAREVSFRRQVVDFPGSLVQRGCRRTSIHSNCTKWSSLKLVCVCLHSVWISEKGQSFRALTIVPNVRIPVVVNQLHNGPCGGHLKVTTTLERLKQRFYWVGCRPDMLSSLKLKA